MPSSGAHGADDVDGFGPLYQPAARAFKRFWDNGGGTDKTLKLHENAESIAAAATGEN